jgi:hypothetical protein
VKTIALTLAALATSTVLAGCAHDDTKQAAKPASSPSTSHSATATPSRTALDLLDPVAMAKTIFATWAQPGLDYDTWWAQLKPLLSPEAEQAYAYTDPQNIPNAQITGPAKLGPIEPDSRGEIRTVTFPTNFGKFGVQVIRAAGDGPLDDRWRMLSLVFPDGIH